MRIVYLDCFSGISGDMTLAALVDAGADRQYIEQELAKLALEPFTIQWKRVQKKGISALKMDVLLDPDHPPTHHRHYAQIVEHITKAGFNERVTALSLAIFQKIGAAEAKIHGIPMDKVHFHEVGAIDSIVDVIGIALALDSLQADRILASPVPLGSGTVHCDHGLYPVPAPATLEMMRGLPISPSPHTVELTTPTGAGVIAGVVHDFSSSLPSMIVETIGYGAGTRDLPNQPNVLRAVIGHVERYMSKYPVHSEQVLHEHGHEHLQEHHHRHAHGHDHDHHHGHGHAHEHDHDHHHGHAHEHDHDHHHGHAHGHDHDHHHGHAHGHDHDHQSEDGSKHRPAAPHA